MEICTIGDFSGEARPQSGLRLSLPLGGLGLRKSWERCGVVANSAASLVALVLDSPGSFANSLSFLLNELLENAVKYGDDSDSSVELLLFQTGPHIVIEMTNSLSEGQAERFRDVAKLLTDPCLKKPDSLGSSSGIGLLTIMSYFQVGLGFRFDPPHVTVQAKVAIKELSHEN